MVQGKDQTFARDFNMKAILQLLSKAEMSCSELADKSGLSKPAMTKITSEMYKLNLITQGEKDDAAKPSLGRKRVYLSMNPNFGVVAGIDFSTVTIKIWVCDMRGKPLLKKEIPDSEYLTPEILQNICDELKKMLETPDLKNKELLSICVAASGMVDKLSGEVVISPKFKACAGIDLRNYFAEIFNCKVEIANDVNLALIGEQKMGNISSFTDAMMIYVDSGIGGALLVDNKIVEGSRGFAGELGLIEIKTERGYEPLDSLCSINAMKAAIRRKGRPDCIPEKFRFADVVKAYHQLDPVVVSVVDECAEVLSCVIRNLSVSLDSHNAIITGRVRLLGLSFLQKLRSAAPNCVIEFNRMEGDGIISGAVQQALSMAIDIVIDRR